MTQDSRELYAVYHAHNLHALVAPQPERWFHDRASHYRHVADVVAPLERVFALTNHIDRPWTDNPEVVWHALVAPLRSTSVGDVIVSTRSGTAWLVLPLGLQELSPDTGSGTRDDGRADTSQPASEREEDRS